MKYLFAACLVAVALGSANWAVATDVYSEDFESGNGGFSASGAMSTWQYGAPVSEPSVAQSGTQVWATSLSGNYAANEDSYIVSPVIDLSAHTTGLLCLSWWQYLQREDNFDDMTLELTNDGGGTWYDAYQSATGDVEGAWTRRFVLLDPSMAVSNFRFRFRMTSDESNQDSGLAIDTLRIFSRDTTSLFQEDFNSGAGAFTTDGVSISWEWGIPGGEVDAAWVTNLEGFYNPGEDSVLVSPSINLSTEQGKSILVSWNERLSTEAGIDLARVDVKKPDGTWVTVRNAVSGLVSDDWTLQAIVVGAEFVGPDFQVRFGLQADGFFENTGFQVDDFEVRSITGGTVPVIAWSDPAPIESTEPLGPTQLNASSGVSGSFDYTPAAGTLLPVGNDQVLTAVFSPDDLLVYDSAIATVMIDVTNNTINYDTWESFPAGGPVGIELRESDYDGDGRTNFEEYALVTNAESASDPTGLPQHILVDDGGQEYQALKFRVRSNDPSLTYNFQVSPDLVGWSTSTLSFDQTTWALTPGARVLISAVEIEPDVWELTIRDVQPFGNIARQFMRLQIIES